MPAVSQKQQELMGAALERKREGNPRPGDPKMSVGKLKEFASTKHKGLPLQKKSKGMLHDSMLPSKVKNPGRVGSTDPHQNRARGHM